MCVRGAWRLATDAHITRIMPGVACSDGIALKASVRLLVLAPLNWRTCCRNHHSHSSQACICVLQQHEPRRWSNLRSAELRPQHVACRARPVCILPCALAPRGHAPRCAHAVCCRWRATSDGEGARVDGEGACLHRRRGMRTAMPLRRGEPSCGWRGESQPTGSPRALSSARVCGLAPYLSVSSLRIAWSSSSGRP